MALSDKKINFVFYLDIHVKLYVVDFYDIVFDKMYESVELLISLGKSLTHICQSCEYLYQNFKFVYFRLLRQSCHADTSAVKSEISRGSDCPKF